MKQKLLVTMVLVSLALTGCGGGGSTTTTTNIPLPSPTPTAGSFSVLPIAASGILATSPSQVETTPANPLSFNVDPSGKYLFVNSYDSVLQNYYLSEYAIGTSGTLSPMSTPQASSNVFNPIAFDPVSNYVYIINGGYITEYTISANGILSPVSTPTVPTFDSTAWRSTIDPSGKYLYEVNSDSSNISEYTIGVNGVLSPMATPTVSSYGSLPVQMVIDPSGKYAYVSDSVLSITVPNGVIAEYTIGANGELIPMATPAVLTTGLNASAIVVAQNDKYVYVLTGTTNSGGGSIEEYSISSNGELSEFASVVLPPNGSSGYGIGINSTSTYVYVSDGINYVTYSVGANGVLALVGTTVINTVINTKTWIENLNVAGG
jgi:6-phosphogluconolactonase (cycloisomerase 2 family)